MTMSLLNFLMKLLFESSILTFQRLIKLIADKATVTAKRNPPYDFISRFFVSRVGVNEDPVTGSAHCKLVEYWQKKLGKSQFLAYQASPRGESLGIRIVSDRVHLSGQAVTVLEGTMKI